MYIYIYIQIDMCTYESNSTYIFNYIHAYTFSRPAIHTCIHQFNANYYIYRIDFESLERAASPAVMLQICPQFLVIQNRRGIASSNNNQKRKKKHIIV